MVFWHITKVMLKNYFKIALRNLIRNKAFSFINIFGLAVGLATCLLIMLYIFSELGYDSQNKDAGRIYRIANAAVLANDKPWAALSAPVAQGLKADMPEVEQSTRLLKFPSVDRMLLKYEQGRESRQFYETNGYYVDSNFFRVFSYDFLYGSDLTALDAPNSIVLSATIAGKLFGKKDPVGQSMSVGLPWSSFKYTVRGVFKDADLKSHIPVHFFLSMHNNDIGVWVQSRTNWATSNIFHTYVKLKAGADPRAFEQKLQPFIERRAGADLKALGVSRKLFIQPLQDIYLHSHIEDEIGSNGNSVYLYILGSIAVLVLLIACINFMNLATARSGRRAKEVGVRKVMGAEQRSLVLQFLGESMIMTGLALIMAMILAAFILPFFNTLTQKNLRLFDQPGIWLKIVLLATGTGILSGLYPAFYLSSFKPIAVLKGKLLNSFSAGAIRKGLVVFQFTISICLILGSVIIVKQLHFLDNQELGFNKKQQIVLPLQDRQSKKNYAALKNELLKDPAVRSVTSGSIYPGIGNIDDMLFYPEGKTVQDVIDMHTGVVDNDYFETLGLQLLKGRNLSRNLLADSNSVVLNEAALEKLGYNINTGVGKKIYYDFQGDRGALEIIGVVKNFNFESLYNAIKPFAFNRHFWFGNRYNYVIANLATQDFPNILKHTERSWSSVNPGSPFVYSFLDKDFQKNYEKDQQAAGLVGYFTVIAIVIACLGLFGLSAFSAEQRVREIGIRKVLGASVGNVTSLLSRDFIGPVLISVFIASPVAWYGMNAWLQNFVYRTPISWWMFVFAGLMAVFIALVTVSFQAIKAALANPVRSLRAE